MINQQGRERQDADVGCIGRWKLHQRPAGGTCLDCNFCMEGRMKKHGGA
jgi:hypothetical protein